MTAGSALGVTLIVLALAIVAKQATAKSCPRHSRVAGVLAWLLALGCAGAGLWLLVAAP